MLEDFSANIEHEGAIGEKAFERDEPVKETLETTPVEQKPAEKPSQGGDNTPAVENNRKAREESRWQKAQKELQELREWRAKNEPRLETYQQMVERLGKPPEQPSAIPDWFPKTGNKATDEQKYKEYLSYENGVKAQIKQELLEDQSREAREKAAEQEKWTQWVNDSLDKLEDEGKVFDRKELQSVALRFLPSDEHGNIDFGRAYEIMTELKKTQTPPPEKSQARKEIGSLSTTIKQSSEQKRPQFETQRSLRNKTFDQLIRETN